MATDLSTRLKELQQIRETAAGQMREALDGTEPECPQGCGPATMIMSIRKIIDQVHYDEEEGDIQCPNNARQTLDALIYHVLTGAADAMGIERY